MEDAGLAPGSLKILWLQSKVGMLESGLSRSWLRFMEFDRSLPGEIVDQLWQDPDGVIESGEILKAGSRCTVVRVDGKSSAWVLTRYNLRGWLHTARHALLRTRARRCWLSGLRLIRAGVSTPRPVAYREDRWGLLRGRSYLLTNFIAGTKLYSRLKCAAPTPLMVNDIMRQMAEFWHQFHELGVSHGDMKLANVLIDTDSRLWVIDLDSMRQHRRKGSCHRAHSKDIARFTQNLHKLTCNEFVSR